MYQGDFVDISLENDYTDDDYQEKVELAEINPFRYRSYYLDDETGLYYLNSRYYDSVLGRFINADSLTNLDKESFNGLNLFAYCLNNPINLTDSKCTSWWSDLWDRIKRNWDVIVGAIVSIVLIVVGVVLTVASGGTLAVLGGALIGAGIGGFISGLQNKLNGNSFWSGYLGGAVGGAITGVFSGAGPLGLFFAGIAGNMIGSAITDSLDGEDILNWNYWINLAGDSLGSGIGAMLGGYFSKFTELIKPLFKDIFVAFTVWSEFAFSAISDWIKDILNQIKNNGLSLRSRR